MSNYEIRIGKVSESSFAIGENAQAHGQAQLSQRDRDDLGAALLVVLGIAASYEDAAAVEVVKLARAAKREVAADQPGKGPFQRLAAAAGVWARKLGPGLVEAGALA